MGRFKIKTLLHVAVYYLIAAIALGNLLLQPGDTAGYLPLVAGIVVVYVLLCVGGMYGMYRGALSRRRYVDEITFRRSAPFRRYGMEVVHFQHVFHYGEYIIPGLIEAFGQTLNERLGFSELQPLNFTDRDKEIPGCDTRTFHVCSDEWGKRQSTLTFVAHGENSGTMQSISWWIFISGFIDKNDLFRMLAAAPLTVPFRIIPYLRREYDPLYPLISIHPGFYNAHDLITGARYIQDTVFDELVDYLNRYGIDTSDLKSQRATVMNINVSGGRAQFGSVIQGALNKVVRHGE